MFIPGAIKYAIIIVAMLVGLGIKTYWPNYEDDNMTEEFIERCIQEETGVDFDITPLSPEEETNC